MGGEPVLSATSLSQPPSDAFVVFDGTDTSNVAMATVNMVARNDAPLLYSLWYWCWFWCALR